MFHEVHVRVEKVSEKVSAFKLTRDINSLNGTVRATHTEMCSFVIEKVNYYLNLVQMKR